MTENLPCTKWQDLPWYKMAGSTLVKMAEDLTCTKWQNIYHVQYNRKSTLYRMAEKSTLYKMEEDLQNSRKSTLYKMAEDLPCTK